MLRLSVPVTVSHELCGSWSHCGSQHPIPAHLHRQVKCLAVNVGVSWQSPGHANERGSASFAGAQRCGDG